MSSTAIAVIGANWGDEGKGLVVDAIAARLAAEGRRVTVVRSNGGAQAGHGVERPEGGRHVFHHVGAGFFTGAATHLSQFFVAHPMMLVPELAALRALDPRAPGLSIDPRAPVTTPWDVAINQALEMARDGNRHGSTGLGFGETIERTEKGPALRAGDLWRSDLTAKLAAIRQGWLPRRVDQLGLEPAAGPLRDILTGKLDVTSRFLADVEDFRRHVALRDDADLARGATVLFEGAQGLQLDMVYGVFPTSPDRSPGCATCRPWPPKRGSRRSPPPT